MKKGMMSIELKKIEEGIIPIYESKTKEKLINARELFYELRGKETKTKFSDWIKERLAKYKFVENTDYICFRNFTKADRYGNKTTIEYYLTKNEYWQVYFKPLAVEKIIRWFNKNKEELYYEVQYIRNTKNGKKGEIKEKGYKIEEVCYKVINT